jgi:hypothetical protein
VLVVEDISEISAGPITSKKWQGPVGN